MNNDINNPELWKKYFDKNFNKCNIFLISKTRKVNSFFKKYLVNEFIEHNNFFNIKSILKLLELSYKNGLNKYFIILNQNSIPKHKFDYLYNLLLKTNKSFINYEKVDNNKIKNFYRSKFEQILNRTHTRLLLNKKSKNLHLFNKFDNPENYYNINVINIIYGIKNIKKNIQL